MLYATNVDISSYTWFTMCMLTRNNLFALSYFWCFESCNAISLCVVVWMKFLHAQTLACCFITFCKVLLRRAFDSAQHRGHKFRELLLLPGQEAVGSMCRRMSYRPFVNYLQYISSLPSYKQSCVALTYTHSPNIYTEHHLLGTFLSLRLTLGAGSSCTSDPAIS